jgi:hypothetical protein
MRSIALSLGAVCSLGVMALGGRAIAGERTAHSHRVTPADAGLIQPAGASADRVWFGGTLAPIVVVATGPEAPRAHRASRDCAAGGT